MGSKEPVPPPKPGDPRYSDPSKPHVAPPPAPPRRNVSPPPPAKRYEVTRSQVLNFLAGQVAELQRQVRELEQPAKPVIGKDVPGGVPSLRPGDVVKVGGHIGVVVKSQTVVRGADCNWDSSKLPAAEGNMPSYAIEFQSGAKDQNDWPMKHAWWELSEIDEVVSLGPFHEVANG